MENNGISKGTGRIGLGLLLLVVGVGWVLRQMSAPIPDWLVSWKTMLIVIGLFLAIQRKFRGVSWLIMIVIGSIFLAGDIEPSFSLHEYTWPVILIAVGAWFILNPRSFRRHGEPGSATWQDRKQFESSSFSSTDDYLEVVSVFGGIRKVILSKDFKGGEATSFLGGTELDLSQADINGRVELEVTAVLGGAKLIVPPTWDVRSELVTVLGGIEDKRNLNAANINPEKILVLKGTCVLGGIDIRSY